MLNNIKPTNENQKKISFLKKLFIDVKNRLELKNENNVNKLYENVEKPNNRDKITPYNLFIANSEIFNNNKLEITNEIKNKYSDYIKKFKQQYQYILNDTKKISKKEII